MSDLARPGERLRRGYRAAATRAIYALDNILGLPPFTQLAVLLAAAALAVLLLSLLAALALPKIPGAQRPVWWVLTLLMDGGTMAGDQIRSWQERLIAFLASLFGVLLLSLLTAAFASKMAERMQEIRSGRSPVVERDHVLVLGLDRKVPLIARELARSRQRLTLVVLAPEGRERLDALLRPARRVPGSRLRIVVRSGDPRSEHALQLVAAARARVVLIIPPQELGEEARVHWTLGAMLAVRHTAECGFRGQVMAEAARAADRELLLLAAEAGVAGPEALPMEVVASDDLIARMLVQSLRQAGIYHALHKILTFDRCEIRLAPVPQALLGMTFDGAHEAVTAAVLLGVRRPSGAVHLNPTGEDALFLERGDRLVLLTAESGAFGLDGRLPTLDVAPQAPAQDPTAAERVVILGASRNLCRTVQELARWLPPGSRVRVVYPPAPASPAPLAAAAGQPPPQGAGLEDQLQALANASFPITVEVDRRPPLALAAAGDEVLYGADAIVILGDASEEEGDAPALTTLLSLRHGAKSCGRALRRVVTEVRDPRSAHLVSALANDILVGSELVAMLLAQQALDPELAPVFGELLSPWGNELAVHPRSYYVGSGPATFAEVMAAARLRGEVALGLYDRGPRRHGHVPLDLNPPRHRPVPQSAGCSVVVMARPAR